MNEDVGLPAAPEPVAPVGETVAPETPPTLAGHAAQFGPEAQKETKAEPQQPEAVVEKPAPERTAAQQKRDKDTGQFQAGKQRHRAQSQQATPEDVPRIRDLTAKLRAAEAERDALKTAQAPPRQVAAAEAKVARAEARADTADPEPKEDDPAFGGDYGKYLVAQARWAARDEGRAVAKAAEERAQRAQAQQSYDKETEEWFHRVDAAKAKYEDFESVALAPNRIPKGSAVEAFIFGDDAGADILYHLQLNPKELDEILRMPVIKQVRHLSLLSQRLVPPEEPEQAAVTGSAATPKLVVLPPRPPNPVRTGGQRDSKVPPPTDGSLSLAEHAKAFGHKRR